MTFHTNRKVHKSDWVDKHMDMPATNIKEAAGEYMWEETGPRVGRLVKPFCRFVVGKSWSAITAIKCPITVE